MIHFVVHIQDLTPIFPGAFIALINADDENLKAAAAFYREAREGGTRFVTTNFVVCETMNFLRARISYDTALLF